MTDIEMRDMLIEYMGKGFLDNIIAMLRQDASLYRFIPDMLGAENLRVRLGATALVEELAPGHDKEMKLAVPGVIQLLKHELPTIRGDAANVLGIIKAGSAVAALKELLRDEHAAVRESAREALDEIERSIF